MRLMVVMALVLTGCPKKNIVRSSAAFAVETLSALARQEEAATALHKAAKAAKKRGDTPACVEYAAPALLIDAAARHQANRALWLAGLPYPDADGNIPKKGVEQADPGPSSAPIAAKTYCE